MTRASFSWKQLGKADVGVVFEAATGWEAWAAIVGGAAVGGSAWDAINQLW